MGDFLKNYFSLGRMKSDLMFFRPLLICMAVGLVAGFGLHAACPSLPAVGSGYCVFVALFVGWCIVRTLAATVSALKRREWAVAAIYAAVGIACVVFGLWSLRGAIGRVIG